MHRRTRKLEFDSKTRCIIIDRDQGRCLFCSLRYHMDGSETYWYNVFDVMHYIPRSKGGLGIEKNGVLGCRYHHQLLDNGNKGLRPEMLSIMRGYLQGCYPEWTEQELTYRKGC